MNATLEAMDIQYNELTDSQRMDEICRVLGCDVKPMAKLAAVVVLARSRFGMSELEFKQHAQNSVL
jgi:hypothetical protein